MIRIEDILDKAGDYCDDADVKLLRRAYVFSARAPNCTQVDGVASSRRCPAEGRCMAMKL